MNDTVKARPFTIDELRAYLIEILPEFWKDGDLRVEDIAPMSATVRLIHHPKHLRPGGTISGPAMFGVCDSALFVAILSEIGPVAHAVTTSASMNFLRKPRARRSHRQDEADQAWQKARRRRGGALFRGRERDGRPRDRDLFSSRARRRHPDLTRVITGSKTGFGRK